MRDLIVHAINNKKCLSLKYQGYLRIVEPHAIGISPQHNDVMRIFQTRGGSKSGKVPDLEVISAI